MPRVLARQQTCRLPGQTIVEFALVSLLLVMLTFGVIDLGRAVIARSMLTNAVREASRYGTVAVRSPERIPNNTNCGMNNSTTPATRTFCMDVVAAAQRTSPSLGLTVNNFSVPNTTTRRLGCAQWLPSSGTGFWDSSADGTLLACQPTGITDYRLTVCVEYQFGLTAPRLIGFRTITMRECARGTIQ